MPPHPWSSTSSAQPERPQLRRSSGWLCVGMSEFLEPLFIDRDALNHGGLDPEAKFFQFVGQLVPINEVDRRRSVAGCFLNGVARKGSSRYEKTLIGPAYHGTPEIA